MTATVTVGAAGEPELLARIRARLAARPVPAFLHVGIGDDAAVVAPERNTADVLTTDALVEGVHFDRALMGARAIGYRALAVNLSDLAAMGATPRVALLSMGLPGDLPLDDFEAMIEGVIALADEHRMPLAGGNLTRTSGPLFLDVTAAGSVRPRRALLRSGARPGDALYVSGRIGAAAAGLAWLRRDPGAASRSPALAEAIARYRTPQPRVRLGVIAGRSRAASACMDLSDGLGDAIIQLAGASGLGAEVDESALPIHEALAQLGLPAADALRLALGSDDYELLFAVPRRRQRALLAAAAHARVPVARIGVLRRPAGVILRDAEGGERPWPHGYSHFAP